MVVRCVSEMLSRCSNDENKSMFAAICWGEPPSPDRPVLPCHLAAVRVVSAECVWVFLVLSGLFNCCVVPGNIAAHFILEQQEVTHLPPPPDPPR